MPELQEAAKTIDNVLHTALNPRLFRALEKLCVAAISCSDNHPLVRAAVASISLELRLSAQSMHGHETVDAMAIHGLLKKTDPNRPAHKAPASRLSPLTELEARHKLGPSQLSAAQVIQVVWRAFGKFLTISGRGYDKGSGQVTRARALQPMDVMGQEVWETYRNLYCPWYEKASRRSVNRKVGRVAVTEVVFKIVLPDYDLHPHEVDQLYGLKPGDALKTLRHELGIFFDPHGKIQDKVTLEVA